MSTTAPSSRLPVFVTLGALALFATGIGPRPTGQFWATGYDLVLYNVVCLGATWMCFSAAWTKSGDRLAWFAMGLSQLLNVVANLVYTLVVAPMADPPYPSIADVLY